MTVREMKEALDSMPDNAVVLFAECKHHHIVVTNAGLVDSPVTYVELTSTGWTDDCDCEVDDE